MYIGQASKLSGATVKAIRHYDKLNLLSQVTRVGSYRVFTEQDIIVIQLIKAAQNVGFKLSELVPILSNTSLSSYWDKIQKLLKTKSNDIDEQIEQLNLKKKALMDYKNTISSCLSDDPSCNFPQIR